MWVFLTIADATPEDDVTDIMSAVKKFVQDDSKEETGLTVSVYSARMAKQRMETFHLPFRPIAEVYTTGPGAGGIGRKSSYYLARGDNGKIVRKLVSQWPSSAVKERIQELEERKGGGTKQEKEPAQRPRVGKQPAEDRRDRSRKAVRRTR